MGASGRGVGSVGWGVGSVDWAVSMALLLSCELGYARAARALRPWWAGAMIEHMFYLLLYHITML